jgi:lipid-A-disaccharide synthase
MKFGLVAGEASGDALGAGLIRALRAAVPDASFEGVAGPAMVEAGCEQWEPAESLAVMGLIEPLKHVPRLLRLRRELVRRWTASPPDVFIGIDAPDFNFGLEKKLRRAGVKTAHYVSPTIWAWRAGRIKTVKKASDLVLCILPFEPPIYAEHDVDAVFVGHPKADEAPESVNLQIARRHLGIESEEVIVVMPGSRSGEVKRLGHVFAETIKLLSLARKNASFVIPAARPDLATVMREILQETGAAGPHITILDGCAQDAMKAADVVLQASGTAVLEAALLCKPAVAAYRLAPMTWFMARHLFRVRLAHVTLPNLLTEEPLVPEFLQHDAEPEALARAVISLLDDPERRALISARFARLREELALDADQRAADAVVRLARQ